MSWNLPFSVGKWIHPFATFIWVTQKDARKPHIITYARLGSSIQPRKVDPVVQMCLCHHISPSALLRKCSSCIISPRLHICPAHPPLHGAHLSYWLWQWRCVRMLQSHVIAASCSRLTPRGQLHRGAPVLDSTPPGHAPPSLPPAYRG